MWRFRIDSDRNCLHLRTYTYKQFISVIWLHSSIHYCQPSPLITVNYIVKHLPLCYFVHGWINKTLDYTSVSSLIFLRTVNSIFLIFIFIFFLLISDEFYKIVWKNVPKKLKLFWKLKKHFFCFQPQNLVMMGSFPECDVKLCDFEISRVILEGTEVREILGTPDYVGVYSKIQ